MAIIEAQRSIPVEDFPSYEEELALDWTLSFDDIRFILQSVKGDPQILYFAASLNSLKNIGYFLNVEELPNKITHYLAKQLDISPTFPISVSNKSKLLYRQKIKDYFGYHDFSENEANLLKEHIQQEMQKELFSVDQLKKGVYVFLKARRITRPSPALLDRIVSSYRKDALEFLYERLANKLTSDQKIAILSLLKKKPNLLSQANYYKKSPPEATASKINIFINRFNELNTIGITQIEFSDISEAVFNQLELLGRTYDANAIKQLRSDNKKIALLLCTLTSASQSILDHILDMNDKLLSKKERLSRNLYNNKLKKINRQAKKGLRFLIKTTKRWWHHQSPEDTTLSDFIKTVDS